MAVRFDASGDQLNRTTNLPGATSAWTVMGWFRIVTDRNAYSTFMAVRGDSLDHWYVGTGSDGTTLLCYNPVNDGPNGTNLSVGVWYHVSLVRDGTGTNNLRVYLNGVLDSQHNGDANPSAFSNFYVGNNGHTEWLNGRAAAVKMWDAALTVDEIKAEIWQYTAVRRANLNGGPYPCWAASEATTDYGPLARNLSSVGTLTTEEGPPIPWRLGRPKHAPYAVAVGGGGGRIWKLAGRGGGLAGPSRGLAAKPCI